MTTSNISITTTWTQIATSSDSTMLVTWDTPVVVEFAKTITNVPPTVVGHKLQRDQALTRNVLGSGFVWARLVDEVPAQISMVVSK